MKIIIDAERVQSEIPADVVLDAMDGSNPRAVLNFIGHFVCDDDGKPMEYAEGRVELGKLPFAAIGELMNTVRKETHDLLVPPASAKE